MVRLNLSPIPWEEGDILVQMIFSIVYLSSPHVEEGGEGVGALWYSTKLVSNRTIQDSRLSFAHSSCLVVLFNPSTRKNVDFCCN
jgi:hypothetical protein